MNKENALALLQALFAKTTFVVHPDVISEIMDVLKHSGSESKVFTTLAARLQFLAEHKQNASIAKEFEPLGSGIYSLHISVASKNLRILYAFYDPDTVLLLAFNERAGKRRTDYTGKIELAKQRLSELIY